MSQPTSPAQGSAASAARGPATKRDRRRRWRRLLLWVALPLFVILLIGRAMLPSAVRWYVNRVLAEDPVYLGTVGDIDVQLFRGAYVIRDVTVRRVAGSAPVPLFTAKSIDLAVKWSALLRGKVVGTVSIERPVLNFVDAPDADASQSGDSGPWLGILGELFPFRLDSGEAHGGAVHLRLYGEGPPVDVYLTGVDLVAENFTNVRSELSPLLATVRLTATAMDDARLEAIVKVDPFSYRPTFQAGVRMLGLDVTKLNDLSERYGWFTFSRGWLDLVVELDVREAQIDGYVKPLFRDLAILTVPSAMRADNPLQLFWEAILETTTDALRNQPRQQFGTVIPFTGSVDAPRPDVLSVVGNVLRNAFIRAYVPRLVGRVTTIDNLQFGPAQPDGPKGQAAPTDRYPDGGPSRAARVAEPPVHPGPAGDR